MPNQQSDAAASTEPAVAVSSVDGAGSRRDGIGCSDLEVREGTGPVGRRSRRKSSAAAVAAVQILEERQAASIPADQRQLDSGVGLRTNSSIDRRARWQFDRTTLILGRLFNEMAPNTVAALLGVSQSKLAARVAQVQADQNQTMLLLDELRNALEQRVQSAWEKTLAFRIGRNKKPPNGWLERHLAMESERVWAEKKRKAASKCWEECDKVGIMKGTMRSRRLPQRSSNAALCEWDEHTFILTKDAMVVWFKHSEPKHCAGALCLSFASVLPPKLDSPGNDYPLWSFRLETPLSREVTEDEIAALQSLENDVDDMSQRGRLSTAEDTMDQLEELSHQSGKIVAPISFEFQCGSLLEREAWVLSLAGTIEASQPRSALHASQAAALDYHWALCNSGDVRGGSNEQLQTGSATGGSRSNQLHGATTTSRSSGALRESEQERAMYAEQLSRATAERVQAAELRQEEELAAELAQTQREIAVYHRHSVPRSCAGDDGKCTKWVVKKETKCRPMHFSPLRDELEVTFSKFDQHQGTVRASSLTGLTHDMLTLRAWECTIAGSAILDDSDIESSSVASRGAAPNIIREQDVLIEMCGVDENGHAVAFPDEPGYGVMITAVSSLAEENDLDLLGRVIRFVGPDPVAGLSYAQTAEAILGAQRPLKLSFVLPSFETASPPLYTVSSVCDETFDRQNNEQETPLSALSVDPTPNFAKYLSENSSGSGSRKQLCSSSSSSSSSSSRDFFDVVGVEEGQNLGKNTEERRNMDQQTQAEMSLEPVGNNEFEKHGDQVLCATEPIAPGFTPIWRLGDQAEELLKQGELDRAEQMLDRIDAKQQLQNQRQQHQSLGRENFEKHGDQVLRAAAPTTPGLTPIKRLSDHAEELMERGELARAEQILDRVEDLQDMRESRCEEDYAFAQLQLHYGRLSDIDIGPMDELTFGEVGLPDSSAKSLRGESQDTVAFCNCSLQPQSSEEDGKAELAGSNNSNKWVERRQEEDVGAEDERGKHPNTSCPSPSEISKPGTTVLVPLEEVQTALDSASEAALSSQQMLLQRLARAKTFSSSFNLGVM